MNRPRSARLVALVDGLYPGVTDAAARVRSGDILVDGFAVTNPESRVRAGSVVKVRPTAPLRGSVKLRGAFEAFHPDVLDRVCVDVGAAAGGFTTVLLEAGARRVYAVDVGHGQLLGSLRQHPKVINLEATNVANLDDRIIPDAVGVVVVDVSYLALGAAVAQLGGLRLADGAQLVGLVKPMFELHLSAPPDEAGVAQALSVAVDSVVAAGWEVLATAASPITGANGAHERFLYARFLHPSRGLDI